MTLFKILRLKSETKSVIVAMLLGVDPSYYSRIENEQSPISQEKSTRVQRLLENLVALRREFPLLDFSNVEAIRIALTYNDDVLTTGSRGDDGPSMQSLHGQKAQ